MEVSFVVQFPTLRDASPGRAAEVETKANPNEKYAGAQAIYDATRKRVPSSELSPDSRRI